MMNPGLVRALVQRCAASKAKFAEDGMTRCPVCEFAGFEHARARITSTKCDEASGVTIRTHQCPTCGLPFSSIEAIDEADAMPQAIPRVEVSQKKESVHCTDRKTKRRRKR